jgi:serine/threonine-protein kinase
VVNPKVDAGLSGIVARAMARKPGDRHRSARQLSRALRAWISDETNGQAHAPAPARARGWVWGVAASAAAGLVAGAWWFAQPAPVTQERVASATPALQIPGPSPAPAQVLEAVPAATAAAASAAPTLAAAPALPVEATPAQPAEAAPARLATAPPAPTKARPDAARVVRKDTKPAAAKPAPAPAPAAPPAQGQVQLAVTPWGSVEVGGRTVGTTPPLTQLTLPVGTHQIVVRNGDLPVFTARIAVSEDKPVTLRHRFE